MIKGINRTIIEVTETDNIYYERALLVLRPEYASVQRALLEKEAKKMIHSLSAPSVMRKCHVWGYWAVRLGISALAGAVFTLCTVYFCR